MPYAEIVGSKTTGLDIVMDLGAELTVDLSDYHYWAAQGWKGVYDHDSFTGPAEFTITEERQPPGTTPYRKFFLTIRAVRLGERIYFLRNIDHREEHHRFGLRVVGFAIHVTVEDNAGRLRTHAEDDELKHNPRHTGYLLVGDTAPKAQYPVPCKWSVHLGPGDDGIGKAIVYTDRYIRPGEQFLFPDDHVGTIQGVRPIHLRATGERLASSITVGGVEAREVPDSGCIKEPPASITVSSRTVFSTCTHDPNASYAWAAHDDAGAAVGTWSDSASPKPTFTAPDTPGRIHVSLTTTVGDHAHVHGAVVWVALRNALDEAPAAIPQSARSGDAPNRKRFRLDIRHQGLTIELSGDGLTFMTADGIPITAPVVNPPIGPFDFIADGDADNGALQVTMHGTVYKSLFATR